MSLSVRSAAKRTALQVLRASGAYRLSLNSKRRSGRLLILCYHGISLRDEHEWAGHLFITPQRFRERLTILRDLEANVLPLGEAIGRLRNASLPPRSVVITFDDGFYDFYKHATPILKEFNFPATLYLTTYYSGRPIPIVNLIVDYLIWKSGEAHLAFPEQGISSPVPVGYWADRMGVVSRLMKACEARGMTTDEKNEFARELASRFGIDYTDLLRSRMLQIMTPEEAVQVSQAGIDIQLHTHRHRTPLDRDLFLREIVDNRRRIAEITGKDATHFCYPSGVYDPAFFPWLRESGIQTATTCVRGFAQPSSDVLLLPRVLDDSNMPSIEFEAVVSGLFA